VNGKTSIYFAPNNPSFTLDVGCGHKKLGTINVDLDRKVKPNVVCSVNALPFQDNVFDVVFCHEVLEHKGVNPEKAVQELLRTSKQFVDITVPHWLGSSAHGHMEHKNWMVMHRRFWNNYNLVSILPTFECLKFFPLLSKPNHYLILLRKPVGES